MSDIKVGDKVYLNPESEYGDLDPCWQLPIGEIGYVINSYDDGWVDVEWTVDTSEMSNNYKKVDLIKVELKLEEDKPLTVHKVGQNVSPKEVNGDILTGCGVILSVLENKYNVSYEVLTDFGNVITLTDSELNKHYKVNGRVEDVEERIQIQMDKLTNAWIKLKDGDYNGQSI